MTNHLEAIAALGLLILGAIAPSETTQVICLCGVGGALGGFVGAAQFPAASSKKLAMRWLVNFSLALFVAPFVAYYATEKMIGVPLPFLALASGGLIGTVGVAVLNIILPAIYKRVQALADASPTTKRNGSEDPKP